VPANRNAARPGRRASQRSILPLLAAAALLAARPAAADGDCQPVRPPAAAWSFGTSELARGYLRAGSYQTAAPAHELRATVLLLAPPDDGAWQPCDEQGPTVTLRRYALDGLHPGALLETRTLDVELLPAGLVYGGDWEARELRAELDPPLAAGQGWLSLQGGGDPGCLLLWSAGEDGDGMSRLQRGRGWEIASSDLSFCLLGAPCPAPASLALDVDGTALLLEWPASAGAADYRVEQADEMAGPWQPLAATGGQTRLSINAPLAPRRFYRVIAVCR